MSRGAEDEWTWLVVGLALLFVIESHKKPGGGSYTVPMPDWRRPEFEPKENEIVPSITPATFPEMVRAYMHAFRTVTGGPPPNVRIFAMVLAQSALETGQWRKMYEWNPANITMQGKRGFYRLPGDETHKYAAYPDARTGASAHLALLGRKYPKSMGLMLSDTPEAVAQMLKDEGPFYEASVDSYARGMRALFDQFLPLLPGPVT